MDTAIAGGADARTAAMNRTVGGDPPTAMQFNTGKQFDDLVENELLADVDAQAAAQNWKAILPASFVQAVTRNGHVYAVPVNIHGQNWLFYSNDALHRAGVQPPKDLFPALDKLKSAGLIPLAFSGRTGSETCSTMWRGGHDLFVAFWGKRDVAMVKGPRFRWIVRNISACTITSILASGRNLERCETSLVIREKPDERGRLGKGGIHRGRHDTRQGIRVHRAQRSWHGLCHGW